jgi:hypothetical protein
LFWSLSLRLKSIRGCLPLAAPSSQLEVLIKNNFNSRVNTVAAQSVLTGSTVTVGLWPAFWAQAQISTCEIRR